jgi:polyribonucleotide nucleotidyltransferase
LTNAPLSSSNLVCSAGPSGRQIRAIIEEFSLTELDVTETGLVSICSPKTESNQGAKKFISELIKDERSASATVEYRGPPPEVGTVFRGVEVRGVQNFGVFVEILPGLQGLVHVSELNTKRVTSVEGLFKVGDKVDVKLLGINEKGQLRLSRKAVLLEDSGATPDSPAP